MEACRECVEMRTALAERTLADHIYGAVRCAADTGYPHWKEE